MYYVIYNPASQSGKGAKVWQSVKAVLEKEKIEYRVYKTTLERNATDIVSTILYKTCGDIDLMILGGDGTVNEALQAIRDDDFDRVKLMYVPAGSSNDLARGIGLTGTPAEIAERLIKSNCYRMMDIGQLTYNKAETLGYTKRNFIVSAGIGYDAAVCEEAMNSVIKKKLNKYGLGKLCYSLICVKQLLGCPRANLTMTMDDGQEVVYKNAYFVAFMNHCYQGGGLKFCPDAVDDDGYIDLCFANDISKSRVLYSFTRLMKAKHVGLKGLSVDKCKKVRVVSDTPLFVHTDGEVKTAATDITVEVLKGRLKFGC